MNTSMITSDTRLVTLFDGFPYGGHVPLRINFCDPAGPQIISRRIPGLRHNETSLQSTVKQMQAMTATSTNLYTLLVDALTAYCTSINGSRKEDLHNKCNTSSCVIPIEETLIEFKSFSATSAESNMQSSGASKNQIFKISSLVNPIINFFSWNII